MRKIKFLLVNSTRRKLTAYDMEKACSHSTHPKLTLVTHELSDQAPTLK